MSNVEKNVEQREQTKQLGGITGRGFLPGRSGNPNGRPRTRGLVSALHAKVAEVGSIEQQLVDVLLHEALRGKHRLAAVEVIFDRLEDRASQHIQIADVTRELRQKSDLQRFASLFRYLGKSVKSLSTLCGTHILTIFSIFN
jgi:hypothetical protein